MRACRDAGSREAQNAYLRPVLPLPEPLRWEVLYGLQQVDPWLRIFEPP